MNRSSVSSDTPISIELLDACCRKVAERADDKPVSEWTSLEYKRLSSMLNRETEVLLSESTLKRIFGRLKTSERYFPQKATRDALARFTGYRDWQEFELVYHAGRPIKPTVTTEETSLPVSEATGIVPETPQPPEQPRARKSRWKAAVIAAGILGAAVIAAIIFYKPVNGYQKVKHLQLRCLNPVGEVPHSALFELVSDKPLPPEAADLEVSWGEHKFGKPFENTRLTNHLYQYPGVQYAVLSYKGKPIDTVTVQMRTKGWVANAINDLDSIRVFPVLNLRQLQPDNLYASITDLVKSGVDTLDSFIVGFSNIKPSTINGDNCELNVKVYTSEIRTGTRCPYVLILIEGEKDCHYVRMALPNCTALSNYKFSEITADGEQADLRHLSVDLRNGANVRLSIKNKQAVLFVDGKQLLDIPYSQSIGNIIGLKFATNGIGKIESPELTDLRTGEKY